MIKLEEAQAEVKRLEELLTAARARQLEAWQTALRWRPRRGRPGFDLSDTEPEPKQDPAPAEDGETREEDETI